MKKIFLLFFGYVIPYIITGQNNIVPNTADCGGSRAAFSFNIREAWVSNTGLQVSTASTPLCGDLDGDGITEIVATNISYNSIMIFDGRDGALITTIPNVFGQYSHAPSNTAIFRMNGKGAIFNVGAGNGNVAVLLTVSSKPGERPMTFTRTWEKTIDIQSPAGVMPVITDFDGDGLIEIVAGRKIIDAQNGNVLATMDFGGIGTYAVSFPVAVDLDNDGLPEVTVGTEAYKYSRKTIPTLKKWKSLSNITGGTPREGNSIPADINMDGYVDLVFHSSSTNDMTVWSPFTNTVIGTITGLKEGQRSYPFIGDIDGKITGGKKYPEIIINQYYLLSAFTFNGKSFSKKWDMPHTDGSGGTPLTLFDFNVDGIVELVYRDETTIKIFDGSGIAPVLKYSQTCGSITGIETPVIADVTGDGSADMIVTGHPAGNYSYEGELMVFEGGASKWASCPSVWNQQLYSPLWVNTDLSIPNAIKSQTIDFRQTCTGNIKTTYYNGCPIQAPYISENSHCPVDLSPDVYVVSGTISFGVSNDITITVTFGNQGMVTAPANTPIRYYKDRISPTNIIGTGTLGTALATGQTTTITKTFTGLIPAPAQFYARILDDGDHFPATGAFSDCNLTNNTKSFGTLELHKTVDSGSSCVDGTNIFHIELINNTNQTSSPQTFYNIGLIDSLGAGWNYIASTAIDGSMETYNSGTRKIRWNIPLIATGDTAQAIIVAKSTTAGSIRNYVWVENIDGTTLGKEIIEAYVQVENMSAPAAANISPENPVICPESSVILTASVSGKKSYQWYRNNVEITDATSQTYAATSAGNYTVTYYEDPCVSQMSATVTVTAISQATAAIINVNGTTQICSGAFTTLTANNIGSITNPVYRWYKSQTESAPFFMGQSYTTSALTSDTTLYVSVSGSNYCENSVNDRKEVTITAHPESFYNYPDIRADVCSDISPLNLGKYIDTTALISVVWEKVSGAEINTYGTINNGLQNAHLHTYKYIITNHCASDIVRKFYLQTIGNKIVRHLRDTVVVCYSKAEALNLNQILGIDAGGTWEYDNTLNKYVTEHLMPPYTGALIFNGKKAWEKISVDPDYHVAGSKTVIFKYKSGAESCLKGKEYTIVIVLTPDITS